MINYNENKNYQKRERLYSDNFESNNNQIKYEINNDNQQIDKISKKNKIINENKDDTSTNKGIKMNEIKNKNISYLEKYFYYPGIFDENEDLNNNCIYCISGKAFIFLYKNKEKKQCKKILEKIHNNCRIFYDMTSLDKSLTIDFYREYPDSYICTIGECQSDLDAIMTSNVGIVLKAPTNRNTVLSHIYSSNSDILSIKKNY